jgi:hypothetical protein
VKAFQLASSFEKITSASLVVAGLLSLIVFWISISCSSRLCGLNSLDW